MSKLRYIAWGFTLLGILGLGIGLGTSNMIILAIAMTLLWTAKEFTKAYDLEES